MESVTKQLFRYKAIEQKEALKNPMKKLSDLNKTHQQIEKSRKPLSLTNQLKNMLHNTVAYQPDLSSSSILREPFNLFCKK